MVEGGEKKIKKKRKEKNQIKIIMTQSLVHKFRNEEKGKRGQNNDKIERYGMDNDSNK